MNTEFIKTSQGTFIANDDLNTVINNYTKNGLQYCINTNIIKKI